MSYSSIVLPEIDTKKLIPNNKDKFSVYFLKRRLFIKYKQMLHQLTADAREFVARAALRERNSNPSSCTLRNNEKRHYLQTKMHRRKSYKTESSHRHPFLMTKEQKKRYAASQKNALNAGPSTSNIRNSNQDDPQEETCQDEDMCTS